jgi:hypothetical protein
MTTFPYITVAASPADLGLAFIVVGAVVLALALNVLGLIAWLRRRP